MANGVSGSHGIDRGMAPVAVASPARTAADPLPTFGDVLSALNPLQYLPVVGTIYRVVTGDQGSPGLRTAVSLVAGAVMGGPIGVLTSIAGQLIERFLHPEAIMHAWLTGEPATPPPSATPAVASTAAPVASPPSPPKAVVSAAIAAYSRTERLVGVGR